MKIWHGQTQLAVKNVEIEHIIEGGAIEEAVQSIRVVGHLERQRVASQPVVTHETQLVPGNLVVGDHQPTLLEQRDLGVDIDSRFGEFHGQ